MAGDWIPWSKGLPGRLEVIRIARALNIDRYRVACLCMGVWEWADENTTDGTVQGVNLEMLDEAVGVFGMGKAMLDVGWIEVLDGGLRFPKWDRYNTKSAKQRLQARDRQRRHRTLEQRTD